MVTDEMVEKAERVYWDSSNDPEGARDMRAALEAALSSEEPVAAMTKDYLGCEYVSMDVAGIEKIAAAHSKGPTEVVYLYATPPEPSVAVKALQAIVERSYNGELGTSKVIDMRNIALSALSAQVQDVAKPKRTHKLSLSDHDIRMMSEGTMIIGGAQMEMAREIIFLRSLLPSAHAKQEG